MLRSAFDESLVHDTSLFLMFNLVAMQIKNFFVKRTNIKMEVANYGAM